MLFCVRAPKVAGHNETQPSKPRPNRPTGTATPISPRSRQKSGKNQRRAAADRAQHARGLFGIGLGECVARPQAEDKNDDAEKNLGHGVVRT